MTKFTFGTMELSSYPNWVKEVELTLMYYTSMVEGVNELLGVGGMVSCEACQNQTPLGGEKDGNVSTGPNTIKIYRNNFLFYNIYTKV